MGLDVFPTTTTVTVGGTADDTLTLNGAVTTDGALVRVTQFLDLVRTLAGSTEHASVVSENTVPTGAGLASSAFGVRRPRDRRRCRRTGWTCPSVTCPGSPAGVPGRPRGRSREASRLARR